MRSAVHATFGKPAEVLVIRDTPLPEPGAGQVRIRMTLSAIHNHDLITVEGNYGYKPQLPAIGGTEATGTVDALGEGVTHLTPGQRIAVGGASGTWAEYFLAPAESCIPLPDAITDETAAQMVAMPLSALVLLESLGVKEDQWIIQNAATGAVAKVLAMIAASRGINVVNVVRRVEGIEELEKVGISNAVSSSEPDWTAEVRRITNGAPIVAAIDGVGGQAAGEMMSLLAEGGTLVAFGAMSGKPLEISASDLIFKQAAVKGFWLARIMKTAPREDLARWITELVRLIATGTIKLQTGGVFSLEDISAAAKASVEPGRTGKILLKP
jgi:NADPH2:quinone reductase